MMGKVGITVQDILKAIDINILGTVTPCLIVYRKCKVKVIV